MSDEYEPQFLTFLQSKNVKRKLKWLPGYVILQIVNSYDLWKELSVVKEICEFYNAPFNDKDFLSSIYLDKLENIDIEYVIKYLPQGRGTWNYRPDTELPTISIKFVWANGFSQQAGIFFPHLVTALCRRRREEKMNVLGSLKRKEKTAVRRGTSGSVEEKLDRMVQWMHETGPLLQEFEKMNRLHALNYPLDMFSSTLTHQDKGANFENEGVSQEYLGTEDVYEATF
ncbi:hypothetical protein Golax_010331 [Gossypium laxum]|uniref:Uncharacterized protein n=1 Tax=Gossypium laxum TaxID=34288 RepID=A0A7J8ZHC5_9ROSI|nr:hypothetical protein [Gossypium laxum]